MQVAITGNTFPVKNELRALGATWSKPAKAWMIDEAKAEEAKALVARGAVRSASGRGGSVLTRFNSGAETYVNRRGRCIDAPCCGCCS